MTNIDVGRTLVVIASPFTAADRFADQLARICSGSAAWDYGKAGDAYERLDAMVPNDHEAESTLILRLTEADIWSMGTQGPLGLPVVMCLLAEMRLPVLHLVRRDAAQLAMAALLGGADSEAKLPVWLAPDEVVQTARWLEAGQVQIGRAARLAGAKTETVAHEDLVSMLAASGIFRRALRLVGAFSHVPDTLRLNPPEGTRPNILNLDEINDHLARHAPDLVPGPPLD